MMKLRAQHAELVEIWGGGVRVSCRRARMPAIAWTFNIGDMAVAGPMFKFGAREGAEGQLGLN